MTQQRGLRRVPRQPRAKETVARIQQAALAVLAEEGVDGLNTNAIAKRAEVNIATLYSYFNDKSSILYALFHDFETERADAVLAEIVTLRETADWQGWMRNIIELMANFRIDQPAGTTLRRALASNPELHTLDDQSTLRAAQAIADAFTERTPGLDRQHAHRLAKVTVATITHLLDTAFAQTPPDREIVEELKDLIVRYLEPHLRP